MQIARLQALLTCAWLAALLSWLVWHRGSPAVALGGAVAIALAHAWVLGLEFVLQRRVSRGDCVPAAGVAQLWHAWAAEVIAAPRVFCWQQPFRSQRFADVPGRPGLRGVVLVHGYLCNRGAWNPWMQRFHSEGRPFIAVNLGPLFGDIEDHVAAIDAAVLRMAQATGQPPLLVGHSMGGMAIRAWLRQTRAPQRVHRFVTLAAPHGGTWLARFGHSRNTRQLRPDDPWLLQLNRETPPAWRRRFVNFFSNADNIVFPPSHAMLEGADNRLLEGLAHVQILFRPEVIAQVQALLEEESFGTCPQEWPASGAAPPAAPPPA